MPGPHLFVAPNDDGLGPSALTSYIVKAILAQRPDCRVTIGNHFAFEFNRQLYAREIRAGRVEVFCLCNLVQLARPNGDVSIEGTLRLMSDYRARSKKYADAAPRRDFDLILDFGVPAAARWAASRGIPSVSVFDHCWSKTLRMILAGQRITLRSWERLAAEVQEDEEYTSRLFLFPSIVAPDLFLDYWKGLIGAERIEIIPGVLREPPRWSARKAREFLGLTQPGPVLLIQGGGTSVWDEPLRRLLSQLLDSRRRRKLADRQLNLVIWLPDRLVTDAQSKSLEHLERVRRLRPVSGGTIQSILPAIDFMIIRAGGGSVNDAVAHRKPFVCVREPGQSQIEAILAECERREISWPVEIDRFREDPMGTILDQYERLLSEQGALARRMRTIPSRGERELAIRILKLLG